MAFVNPALLGGLLLLGVPIILHLVMRQQPKKMTFPALRFIQQRRQTNQRKLQLRHWLLLLLRCLAIATLVVALTRPSVQSAQFGNWILVGLLAALAITLALVAALAFVQKMRTAGWSLAGAAGLLLLITIVLTVVALGNSSPIALGNREAPVAAAVLIDTAPRMQYRQANQTRIEKAQDIATWLVEQLPAESEVAVVDSSPGEPFFSVDVSAAKKRIQVLKPNSTPQALPESIRRSLRMLDGSQQLRKELYVFTDRNRLAWSSDDVAALTRELDESAHVALYVIDVSAEEPQNLWLGHPQLQAETIPINGELVLRVDVQRLGPPAETTVQLKLEKPDPRRPIRRDGKTLVPEEHWTRTQTISLPENGSSQAMFRLSGLEPGMHQGVVEIAGADSLPFDNRRHFAIDVREAWPVLVLAPEDVNTRILRETLAPYAHRKSGQARFEVTVESQEGLANLTLEDYAAVFLLDPKPMSPPLWDKLTRYVEAGGGLATFLGHNAGQDQRLVKSFNEEAAQQLLGGLLTEVWRGRDGDLQLRPSGFQHPIMAPFRPLATTVPWNEFPVHRHWGLQRNPAHETDAEVILAYSNGMPALVERQVGRGSALTMTTPVSDPARPEGRRRWNDLTLGLALPYFIIVNEAADYLVRSGNVQLNYLAGQTAVLPNDPAREPEQYQLFTPPREDGEDDPPQTIKANEGRLIYRFTEAAGAYRLKGSRGGPVVRGFAVNVALEDSDLTTLDDEQLAQLLGEDRFQLASNREEINRNQGEARVGREFYSLLLVGLVALLGLEHLLANRFYRKTSTTTEQAKRRATAIAMAKSI